MVQIGGIFSVGGAGTGGGGSTSGIQEINGQTGPTILHVGVNGIEITAAGNTILHDAASLSGLITPSGGIGSINGQIGPAINIEGVNGINVSVNAQNNLLIDGSSLSGVSKVTFPFSNITSGIFSHNLGTEDVIVQVYVENKLVIPDQIIVQSISEISLLFNRETSGKVVII